LEEFKHYARLNITSGEPNSSDASYSVREWAIGNKNLESGI